MSRAVSVIKFCLQLECVFNLKFIIHGMGFVAADRNRDIAIFLIGA